MRKELLWLGFGLASPGLFISPHDLGDKVARIAAGLGASAWVSIYRATSQLPDDPLALVRRGWPGLDAVKERYDAFMAAFTPQTRATRASVPRDAFRACFELLSEYRSCLYADPELPRELLPAGWSGSAARTAFLRRHAMLIETAMSHFDAVLASTGGGMTGA
jgi:phenylacetic acid degradation operon negative regulatory protein